MIIKSRIAARRHRRFDLPDHLLNIDKRFPGKMSAALRKFLIFDVAAGQARAFQFVNRARDILRAAKTGVGIDNRRNLHRLRDVTRQAAPLRSASATRCPARRRCVRHSRAADVHGVKPGALHLPRHRSVRHTGHAHAALRDQFTQSRSVCCSLSCRRRHSQSSSRCIFGISSAFISSSTFGASSSFHA